MAAELKRIELDPELDAWEQQPGETAAQYAAFVKFRDLGRTRTVSAYAAESPLGRTRCRDLARARLWVRRADAYDAHQANQWAREQEEARMRTARAVGRVAEKMLTVVEQQLDTRPEDELLPDGALPRWVESADKTRRSAYGEPDVHVALSGPGGAPVEIMDWSGLTPEDRAERYRVLEQQLATRRAAAAQQQAELPEQRGLYSADERRARVLKLAGAARTAANQHDDEDETA